MRRILRQKHIVKPFEEKTVKKTTKRRGKYVCIRKVGQPIQIVYFHENNESYCEH